MEFDQAYHDALHVVADYWALTPQAVENALQEADDQLDGSIVKLYGEDALLPQRDV